MLVRPHNQTVHSRGTWAAWSAWPRRGRGWQLPACGLQGHVRARTELFLKLRSQLVRFVRPVVVFACDGRLCACHVATDDEMGCAEVLADDHVLQHLPRPSHFHRVRKVCPNEVGVLDLVLEGLVCQDADVALDVTGLSWACGTRTVRRTREQTAIFLRGKGNGCGGRASLGAPHVG